MPAANKPGQPVTKPTLGFPYPAIDPLAFLVDQEIRKFDLDKRHDLTGTGRQACPQLSTGVFIVHEHTVPADTCEVIMNVSPHCWARTDVGLGTSSIELIDYRLLAGWVLFDSSKDNNQPTLVENDYNIPTVNTAPNDRDRQSLRGTTWLPADPQAISNTGMRTPLATVLLPANSKFRVIFQLMPVPDTDGVLNPFKIPTEAAPVPPKRIDFAGAKVCGVRMPMQTYNMLHKARREGHLGQDVVTALYDRAG